MQGKFIKNRLKGVVDNWCDSIDNQEIVNLIKENVIITGGAIVSLLQCEEPNDYDCYFKDVRALSRICQYYIDKYKAENPGEQRNIQVQPCIWDDESQAWSIVDVDVSERLRIFIRSVGAVEGAEENDEPVEGAEENDGPNHDTEEEQEEAYTSKVFVKKGARDKTKKYQVKFMTNNAITLFDKIQIVLRFYGSPEEIHQNYDFIHATNYYTYSDQNLVMPSRALEAIINKELFYCGSRYPLCSIVRSRKFIQRGWTINAGQYVKMAMQLNEMDLRNPHVFEEQIIGVDSAYFSSFLYYLNKELADHEDTVLTSTVVMQLIDKVFGE